MRFKQQGALQLFVLVAVLATMIGIAFTVLFFLDRATLNRAHSDRELSARESNPQVRTMTVDTATPKKPFNINDALEVLKQPGLEKASTPEPTGSESSGAQDTQAEETGPEDTGKESLESAPNGSAQDLATQSNSKSNLPAEGNKSTQ